MRLCALVLSLALLAGGAVAAEPAANAAPTADFAAYRTWNWAPRKTAPDSRPAVLDQVKVAIERQMAAQGYAMAAEPDLIVVFTASAREREEVAGSTVHTAQTRYGPLIVGTQAGTRTTNEGALTIQMFDARTKRPVFRGAATERLSPRGADAKAIDRAVSEALAQLPRRS